MKDSEFEIVNKDGIFLIIDCASIEARKDYLFFYGIFEEVFVRNDYERYGCIIKKGDIVVDVGANIGQFSRFAFLRGAGKIYSFEPDPKIYSCLIRNAPINCESFNIGIMGEEGFLDFYPDINSQDNSFYLSWQNSSNKKGYSQKILCHSLTYLFDKGLIDHINFLKVDAEGAERDIFKNLPDCYFDKIDKIFMEWHNQVLQFDGSLDVFVDRLSKWYNFAQSHPSSEGLGHIWFWKGNLKPEEMKEPPPNCESYKTNMRKISL